MATLPCGSGDSHLIASGTQTTSLHNWKIVKNFSTRLTVLRRLGVKCGIEITCVEIQCSVSPGMAVGSTQTQLENSTPSENTATKSWPGRHEIRKALDICKELALDPVRPILPALIGIQALKDRPGGISITEVAVAIAVTVWFLTQIPVLYGSYVFLTRKKQVILLCVSFSLLINGVHAEDPTESCKQEDPNALETRDYAEAAAVTLLVIVLTIGGAGVARRMCNRWRPLPAAPVAPAAQAAPAGAQAGAAGQGAQADQAAAPAVLAPAFDIMGGLSQSPVPTRGDSTFDILPELPEE